MRKLLLPIFGLAIGSVPYNAARAQGLHFSQFYNAPLLLNPANAALMPDSDFRVGANYRNQWANMPVPFRTISAFGDVQLFKNEYHTNWLGVGGSFYNDRAGNGNLALSKAQLTVAYHIQVNERNMFSVGLGAALVQRSVDFGRLTFDAQWDGFTYNSKMSQGEAYTFQKTSYPDLTAGLNYAFIPNESLYLKLGVGLMHVNRPTESFYKKDNKLGIRPTIDLDIVFKLGEKWIADVAGYYSYQKSASETLMGTTLSYDLGLMENLPSVFIMGAYYRLNDAIIPVFGLEWSKVRLTASMDLTISQAAKAVRNNGAVEFSLVFRSLYSNGHANSRDAYNCPRF